MKQFSEDAWLKKHTLSCTEKLTFECSICMKQFTGEDRFTKLVKSFIEDTLTDIFNFKCHECTKSFMTKGQNNEK